MHQGGGYGGGGYGGGNNTDSWDINNDDDFINRRYERPDPFKERNRPRNINDLMQMYMRSDEAREWQYQFPGPETKIYGPFTHTLIKAIYTYDYAFRGNLVQSQGKVNLRRLNVDSEWTELDELSLLLLVEYFKSTQHRNIQRIKIKKDGLKEFLPKLFQNYRGNWVIRYGRKGSPLECASQFSRLTLKKSNNIAITRIGENDWHDMTDVELSIALYHIHMNNIQQNQITKMTIKQLLDKSQTAKLKPVKQYKDEWEMIKTLMKSMRCDRYFDELKKYCVDQEFEDTEAIIEDLEEFVTSDDYEGSMIVDYFREECEFEPIEEKQKHKKPDSLYEDTNDNDTGGDMEQEYIKLGFIIYQSCKLIPILQEWTGLLNENYLEKHFSYARCAAHRHDPCAYIKRLIPMLKYCHVWNRCVVNIPGDINAHSPYWITQQAFFSILPHYSEDRLERDCERMNQIIHWATAQLDVLRDLMDEDADEDGGYQDDTLEVEPNTLKIFHWFDKRLFGIQCNIEECHTTNRKCFPWKSHVPYPIPYHWKRKSKRSKRELDTTRLLDELHDLMYHSEHKFKYLRIEDDPMFESTQNFIDKLKAVNQKYYMKDPPTKYFFEDNLIGKGVVS